MSAWRVVVRLDVTHAYFANGLARDLVFTPSVETAALVESRSLIVKAAASSLALVAQTPDAPRRKAHDETLSFTFRITCADNGFALYSERPDQPRHAVFGRGITAVANVPEPAIGDVTIHVASRDLEGAGEPSVYALAFEARKTLWKYYVVGGVESGTALSIRDADDALAFDIVDGGPERLGDARTAVTLISQAPIALQERPAQRLQLRASTPEGERVLVRRLAVASPHQLGKHKVLGRDVTVSEIYVNL